MHSRSNFITESLLDAENLLHQLACRPETVTSIEKAIQLFSDSLKSEGRILSCGNGGSMCDAMHFAEELTGRFKNDRAPLSAMAISDPSHMTCVANDFGFDVVFSRAVTAWGRHGDSLLAISTSGNSKNVILAVEEAKRIGMKTVALLGKDGGLLRDMVDVALVVPSMSTARIQEMHIKFIHIFIDGIERNLVP